MKFKAVGDSTLDESVLESDYEAAEVFWKARLGKSCLYYLSLFKTAYLPLSEISRAFIRVETTVSRVCCGPAEFNSYYLILCRDGSELASVELDSEVKADRLLAAIAERGIPVGKPE